MEPNYSRGGAGWSQIIAREVGAGAKKIKQKVAGLVIIIAK